MRTLLRRGYHWALPLCLVVGAAGCDDGDWSSRDVIDIINAAGDVVLAILRSVL